MRLYSCHFNKSSTFASGTCCPEDTVTGYSWMSLNAGDPTATRLQESHEQLCGGNVVSSLSVSNSTRI